jgi:hypothetical protein
MPIPSLPLVYSYNDFEEDNAKSGLYFHEGQFIAVLNWDALVLLHFDLQFLATVRNPYEETSIRTNTTYSPLRDATPIGLCEFNTIKRKDVLTEEYKKTGKMIYSSEADRLDFFLTRAEVREAYQQVVTLCRRKETGQKERLFDGLWIHHVADADLQPFE